MKTDSLKNFKRFYKSFGIKDPKIENLCMSIWNESRASAESEEKIKLNKEHEENKEYRDRLHYLKTEAIPDCVFVRRNFGNKWVRNESYGYFKKEKWIVRKSDEHGSWSDSSASFNGFEIEEYPICELEIRRLPEPPQKMENLYFLDDLVFRRDLLKFTFGDRDVICYASRYLPFQSGELDKKQIGKIKLLIKLCNSGLEGYSYRFDGEPCYTPMRFALPPHLRKSRDYYHNEIDERLNYPLSDRMKWQYCPIEIKVQMVKLWIKSRRADRSGDYDLKEKLEKESQDIFPNKVNKPNDISLNQWKTMSQIAKLNTTAGAINEYHNSN